MQMIFPHYILDNPAIEAPSEKSKFSQEQRVEYALSQANDYKAAIQYAEEHILTTPIQAWTEAFFLERLKKLNEIAGKTVSTHPCSITFNHSLKSGLRTDVSHTAKQIPPITESTPADGKIFNLERPDDVASLLIAVDIDAIRNGNTQVLDSHVSGTNFLKWALKFFPFARKGELAALDKNMKTIISHYVPTSGLSYESWLEEFFGGKSLEQWRRDFFADPKNEKFRFPIEGSREASDRRLAMPGLFSDAETAASKRVIKFFADPDNVPKLMEEMATQVIAMIRARKHPIEIVTHFHIAFTNIHHSINAHGRTARLMMNAMLLQYGYPAIDIEGNKVAYYQAVEAGDDNPKVLEAFFRAQIEGHQSKMAKDLRTQKIYKQANDLCLAASNGKLDKISSLLASDGTIVNRAPLTAKGWTALHYACKAQQWAAAGLLITHGARIDAPNYAGKVPLELVEEDPDKKERVANLQVLFDEQQAVKKEGMVPKVLLLQETFVQEGGTKLALLFGATLLRSGKSLAAILSEYGLETGTTVAQPDKSPSKAV